MNQFNNREKHVMQLRTRKQAVKLKMQRGSWLNVAWSDLIRHWSNDQMCIHIRNTNTKLKKSNQNVKQCPNSSSQDERSISNPQPRPESFRSLKVVLSVQVCWFVVWVLGCMCVIKRYNFKRKLNFYRTF